MAETNGFRRIRLNEWQQFRNVDIAFHDQLTILTGANASGKTTILNVLARHFEWDVPVLAVPRPSLVDGAIKFLTRYFGGKDRSSENQIGALTYSNGREARLLVPASSGASYAISVENQQSVPCFFVPSHRAVYRYQAVGQIPVARMDKRNAFGRVWSSTRNRYFGSGDAPASYHMKETLLAWSIFGRGNVDMAPDKELLDFYLGFQEVLRKLLPLTLGFRKIAIRNQEVVLECETGDFMLDGASGGLSMLIDLAWQIFMYSKSDDERYTVLIDEVENHLHPTMQRRLLPDLIAAFPNIQFIVSTHSPLIVNSVRESAVYALRYVNEREIVSEGLDFQRRAKTAAQILDEVLGVSFTMPLWAEKELENVVEKFAVRELTEAGFVEIRKSLADIGLDNYLPQTLARLVDAREASR